MNKYSLIIDEKTERLKDFHTKTVINIQGNSITELLAKLPLEINKVHELYIEKLSNELRHANITDDDIPF